MIARLIKLYKSVLHGVAFIPLVITVAMASLAVFLTQDPFFEEFPKMLKYFRIEQLATTRVLLGSVLTGVISLTVFGFSMMMVVVNQASSNYSPKVVETFMNENYNKFILGIYLGTIVFTMVVLVHLDDKGPADGQPHFAVFINIVFAAVSMVIFLYFINNISNSVRITNIVHRIYAKTKDSLIKEDRLNCKIWEARTDNWNIYPANHSGYFQVVRISPLLKLLTKEDLCLKVLPLPGSYYTTKSPFIALNKPVSQEMLKEIAKNFVSYAGEAIEDNEFYGFRQLREVAVKGLSPGVNDPGVARICVEYMGSLFSLWMSREKNNTIMDKDNKPRIILNRYDLKGLMEECVTPITTYGKGDYTIVKALLSMLGDLSLYDEDRSRQSILSDQALALLQDVDRCIENFLERRVINETIMAINKTGYFKLPLLKS